LLSKAGSRKNVPAEAEVVVCYVTRRSVECMKKTKRPEHQTSRKGEDLKTTCICAYLTSFFLASATLVPLVGAPEFRAAPPPPRLSILESGAQKGTYSGLRVRLGITFLPALLVAWQRATSKAGMRLRSNNASTPRRKGSFTIFKMQEAPKSMQRQPDPTTPLAPGDLKRR
jgi:hypothetical protein